MDDFEIIYKKGKYNVGVYALSIKDHDVKALLCTISIIQSDWINKARDQWKNDEEVQKLIQNLQQDTNSYEHLSGKMINFGTNITYIYVKTPNSNKRC